ncbi:hypothetical protein [Staphylococcus chromogenes]|uniref:hypothetical protein n=1 Tax=Staphylococcus chromogenes TaxID=46126 RepID=UPI0028889E85|nr:hypothetical protein [Staphylococcus chromogenes]MDT0700344.1 hypothetical protein [Staphylococcus chromogenes]
MTDYQQQKINNLYSLHKEIATHLTTIVDLSEEALFSGEGIEDTLEHIGIKSEELLKKL